MNFLKVCRWRNEIKQSIFQIQCCSSFQIVSYYFILAISPLVYRPLSPGACFSNSPGNLRLDFRHSLVSGLPFPRRTAGRVSSKACLWRKFLIKILAALLVVRNVIWWQSLAGPHDTNNMSKVTQLLVCIVLTQCFCSASSVCFGSFKTLVLSGFVRDWYKVLLSFKKTTVHINLLEYFCFLEIDVCVYPSLCWLCSLSDILARHDSDT